MTEIRRHDVYNCELRTSDNGRRLTGYAARYNVESKADALPFSESIAPGAFDRSLEAGDDVVALFNHDPNKILGRRDSGTLRVSTDTKGLRFDLDLPPTALGEEIAALVERRDLDQMSFGFIVREDRWSKKNNRKTRQLLDVSLVDVSVVLSGAYPATSVATTQRGLHYMSANRKQELTGELARLVEEARSIVPEDGSPADVTGTDQERLDKIFERVDAVEASLRDISNAAKLDAAEAKVEELESEPTRSWVPGIDRHPVRNSGNPHTTMRSVADSADYRSAFNSYIRGQGSIQELRDMAVGTDTLGGAVVPTVLENYVIETLEGLSTMRMISDVATEDTDKEIPVQDSVGAASWQAEAATITPVDTTFDSTSISIVAHACTAAVRVSVELLADANFDMNRYLGRIIARRFSALTEEAYVNGSGSSQPTGLFQTSVPTDNTVTASGTTFSTIDADDLISCVFSLAPQYRQGANFVMSDAMLKAVRLLKDSNGQYLWKVSERYSDVRDGNPDTVMGYPVYSVDTDYAPADGTGVIAAMFGNTKQYFMIRDRGNPGTQMLIDPYSNALTREVDYVAYRRTDSKVTLPAAFACIKTA